MSYYLLFKTNNLKIYIFKLSSFFKQLNDSTHYFDKNMQHASSFTDTPREVHIRKT